ncbi:decaprenylphospho-beta-D-ribofuranose 2-oxidase [Litoreibacter halocynthiae]|uniref:Decaprenylphospho-beta-D-ribofuranose 2-oxidase n=1 Tax=Litoreibacter halocynthiae TaxID=1242689 RepID=A0A4R7LL82_9RHOB|nr:FAD-binding oxidoreductase [Litoreibacter halocynthiae]TDT75191.1 decaprenylphospho-beta-D-ribofuranose 2-oxidase [Litoreibacter halocynthiae]
MIWNTLTYTGWGRVRSATAQVARPERTSSLAALQAETAAPAIGMCRSYGDSCLNDGGHAVDMTRMDRLLGFDPDTGILEVEAGARIGDIARRFAPDGWLPSVMPGTGFATVGGCIAHDVHGKNHHGAGSFGQHVVEISLMNGGKLQKVSPSKGVKLFRATIGGMGQTGVIVSAKLQLLPCKGDIMTVTERRIENLEHFLEALDASKSTYTVGWIDATAQGEALGRGILEEAETGYGLVPDAKPSRAVPFNAPRWALATPVVRFFNAAYFRRVPERGRTSVKPITEFFFPLDKLLEWNRLYGKRGFHQFQCVVPVSEAAVLRLMLDKIGSAGLASPLAVLKRMGSGRAGLMSFPMEGYTLAIDFPNRAGAEALIAELEEITEKAGGRVYMAKDATLDPSHLTKMYPDVTKFAKLVSSIDPDGQYETDQTRRLNIRSHA